MRKLAIPDYKVEDVFDTCITQVKTEARRQAYKDVRQLVIDAESEYHDKAKATQSSPALELHTIASHTKVDTLPGDEMEKLYTNNFAGKKGICRNIYSAIKIAPKNGQCPFCDVRLVSSIDHYLPKTEFPSFSITPINLVPSCGDCNHTKSTYVCNSADTQLLHPYYDNIENDKFLFASINEEKAIVEFEVQAPVNWNSELKKRVDNHFEKLKLLELYSVKSAEELSSIVEINKNLFSTGGMLDVKEEMRDKAAGFTKWKKNSWKTATYEAASNSDWYCNEGFLRWA